MAKLKNPRHEAFAQHLALHDSKADAYRHAFKTERMKNETIYAAASRLADDVNVRLRTEELQKVAAEQAQEKFKVDADWMLGRLKEIDEMDVADILDDSGHVKPVSEWPKVWRTTISAMDLHEIQNAKDVTTVVRKLKLPDKAKNLEMLGKHVEVQAFKEQREVEHTASKSLSELLQEAKESR